MNSFLRGLQAGSLILVAGLTGTSCSSCCGNRATASGPGEVRLNSWISCVPDHPETTVVQGKIKMREPGWKLFPDARDHDATVYRTWLHYDADRRVIDDKIVAGNYRYGRDSDECKFGEGDMSTSSAAPVERSYSRVTTSGK